MGDSIDINFAPLEKTADPIGNYANAFKVGRDLAGEKIASNAMQAYGANPTAPIDPRLFAADPKTALALQGQQRDEQTRQANIKTATALASGNTDQAMQAAAATGDITTITHVHEWARQAHEDQVKAASEKAGHLAQISMAIGNAPADPAQPNGPKASPEQRLSMAQHMAQLHPEFGIKPEDLTIDKFTDDGIQSSINETLGVKGALDHALELRKFDQKTAEDAETTRNHNMEHSDRRVTQGIEGAHLALDRQKFAADESHRVTLSPDAADLLAERVLSGDKSALQNIGRGTQGSNDLRMVQNTVAAKAAQRGITGPALAKAMQAFAGDTAAARTAGQLDAKMGIRSGEVDKVAQLAQAASDQVPRSKWQTFNRLVNAGRFETNDPDLRPLLVHTQAVINARAAAIGQGVVHVGDQVEGRQLLSAADGPEAYKAALTAMIKESHAARGAVSDYRQGTAAPAPSAGPKPGDVEGGFRFKGGNPADPHNWTKM